MWTTKWSVRILASNLELPEDPTPELRGYTDIYTKREVYCGPYGQLLVTVAMLQSTVLRQPTQRTTDRRLGHVPPGGLTLIAPTISAAVDQKAQQHCVAVCISSPCNITPKRPLDENYVFYGSDHPSTVIDDTPHLGLSTSSEWFSL